MTAPLPIRILLVALVAVAASPAVSPAQSDGDLATRIQRNTELLTEATMLVRETNSVKARAALEVARKLHEHSVSLLETGSRVMAGRSAFEATEAILRTIAIARQELKLEESARRAIERARHRLEQARAGLEEQPGDEPAARKLIEDARTQLERSHDNMREHMFAIALRLANASADLSARALQMLRRDGENPDRLVREINRTADVIARIDRNATSPQAGSLLQEARELQRRATESARSGRPRIALEQTQRARQIALRVLRSTGPGELGGPGEVERALSFTDEVIERARKAVSGNGGDDDKRAARQRIAGARELQESAKAMQRRGDGEGAMAATLRAREMAMDAVRKTDRPVDREGVRSTLVRTDRALRSLRERLAGDNQPRARALLERAVSRQEEAREAFENDRPRKALALTRIATNLVNNALRVLEGSDD